MSRLSFFFKRLVRMDWKAMWQTTCLLKERSGKSRAWLLCDMLYSAIKYNAGYVDYKIAQFYRLNDAPAQNADHPRFKQHHCAPHERQGVLVSV